MSDSDRQRPRLAMSRKRVRLLMMGAVVGVVAGALAGAIWAKVANDPATPGEMGRDLVGSEVAAEARGPSGGGLPPADALRAVPYGEVTDPLARLGFVHKQLVDGGGMLFLGRLESIATVESGGELRVDVVIGDLEVLWVSQADAVRPGQTVKVSSYEFGREEEALLRELPMGGSVVAAVTSDGELLGIAEVIDGKDLRVPYPVPRGPLFLGAAGKRLAVTGFPPIPGRRCAPAAETPAGRTGLEALVGYFSQLGGITREERIAALIEIDAEVDRVIQAAPVPTDPVTGVEVPVAINDIHRQVAAGASGVRVRATYPVMIVLSQIDLTTHEVLVFADAVTGEVTSWVGLAPTGWVDARGQTHWNDTLTVYIEAPAAGNDANVFLRSTDSATFYCPPSEQEVPWLTIPYDAAFGSRRAVIDVGTRTLSELTATSLEEP